MPPGPAEERRGEPDTSARKPRRRSNPSGPERGFREVPIYPVGFQDGRKRFPQKCPRISAWRNNLSACSQYRNLYFIACLDWIYVYEPQFPYQVFPSEPALSWQLPVSRPGLTGHIPPNPFQDYSAHSVNNLLVANLGNLEILLCACDDGDVIAYYTHTLLGGARESEILASGVPCEGSVSRKPRPYFHENVEKSAWGLAVHTEARLIAVSANSHQITVFAPALCEDPKATKRQPLSADHLSADESTVKPVKKLILQNRHLNRRRALRGHFANIPSVSFCNTSDDKEAIYLASTDIRGSTFIWNIDMATGVRALEPLRYALNFESHADDVDPSKDGWGVMFLDKQCFSRTKSVVQAMGTCYLVKHALNAKAPQHTLSMYNISESRATVRNSGEWNVTQKLQQAANPTENSAESISISSNPFFEISDDSIDEDDGEDERMNMPDNIAMSPRQDSSGHTIKRTSYNGGPSTFSQNKLGTIPEDQIGPGVSQQDLIGHKWTIFSHRIARLPSVLTSDMPQTPLLFMNPRKIHLFQSPDFNLRDENDATQPVVYLEDPLAQEVPASLAVRFQQLDRMNLYAQIPELGVVLVGSPKGRVAVLSLHLLEPSFDPDTGQPLTDVAQPMYTMRLDHVLPFQDEEERFMRPLSPLAGLSVSPVFGIDVRRKRYRVFLTYVGHSILAYEIGREGTDYRGLMDVFEF